MEHLFPFKSADNHRWSALYYGATTINTFKKRVSLFYKKIKLIFSVEMSILKRFCLEEIEMSLQFKMKDETQFQLFQVGDQTGRMAASSR